MTPVGVGIDLVEVSRIAKSATRAAFLTHVFTPGELSHANGRAERLAGLFAAKEAFSKAVGCGLSGVSLAEVEVVWDENGAPSLLLHGETAARHPGLILFLSITHDGGYAAAVVNAYREE